MKRRLLGLFLSGALLLGILTPVSVLAKPDEIALTMTNPTGWYRDTTVMAGVETADDWGVYRFDENGAQVTIAPAKGNTNITHSLNNVDMDVVKGLYFQVDASAGGRWDIKVYNTTAGKDTSYSGVWNGVAGSRQGYFDFSGQGWSGKADLKVDLYVIADSGRSALFREIRLAPQPAPVTELVLDTTGTDNWLVDEKPITANPHTDKNGVYTFGPDGVNITTQGSLGFANMKYIISNVDFSRIKGIDYRALVSPGGGRWDIKVSKNGGGNQSLSGVWNGKGGSDEGFYSFAPYGWSGIGTLTVELICINGDGGNSVTFSNIRLTSSAPAALDSYTVDPSDYFGWVAWESAVQSPVGSAKNGSYRFEADGITAQSRPDPDFYFMLKKKIKNINADVVKGLSYQVRQPGGGHWDIKVYNETMGDDCISVSSSWNGTSGDREDFLDFSSHNWTGVVNLRIELVVFEYDSATAKFSKLALLPEAPDVPEPEKPRDSLKIDMTSPSGWYVEGRPATAGAEEEQGRYRFSQQGMTMTAKRVGDKFYYQAAYTAANMDLNQVTGLLYYVDAPGARWDLKVYNMNTGEVAKTAQDWSGSKGTRLGYFDFSHMGWAGQGDLKIELTAFEMEGGDTATFKTLELLTAKPDPMPEIPKEPPATQLKVDLTNPDGWEVGEQKAAMSGSEARGSYSFGAGGLTMASFLDRDGVFYYTASHSYQNVDLSVLKYLKYKVDAPGGERWDIKVYNESALSADGTPDQISISGSWDGLSGSDEALFSLAGKNWSGACDIRIVLYAFTPKNGRGSVTFQNIEFAAQKPAAPDRLEVDFSDYGKFALSGDGRASSASFSNPFGDYTFGKNGMNVKAKRVTGADGETSQFWADASVRFRDVDLSKIDTLDFSVDLTKGNWTIQVKNITTDETVTYAREVRTKDDAWMGVDLPKESLFNFVKAAKTQLDKTWSGTVDLMINFQALNLGEGSDVTFRKCILYKGPSSIPAVTEFTLDLTNPKGWVLQGTGLLTQNAGEGKDKVARYHFTKAGLMLNTQKQKVDGADVFYTTLAYTVDNVDYSKANAILFDMKAPEKAHWDIKVINPLVTGEKNTYTVSSRWDGKEGDLSGTQSFKSMGWTGVGAMRIEIVGLDIGDNGKDILLSSLKIATGETNIKGAEETGGNVDLDYATVMLPSFDKIQGILNDKNRFASAAADAQAPGGLGALPFAAGSIAVVLIGAGVAAYLLIRKKRKRKPENRA